MLSASNPRGAADWGWSHPAGYWRLLDNWEQLELDACVAFPGSLCCLIPVFSCQACSRSRVGAPKCLLRVSFGTGLPAAGTEVVLLGRSGTGTCVGGTLAPRGVLSWWHCHQQEGPVPSRVALRGVLRLLVFQCLFHVDFHLKNESNPDLVLGRPYPPGCAGTPK